MDATESWLKKWALIGAIMLLTGFLFPVFGRNGVHGFWSMSAHNWYDSVITMSFGILVLFLRPRLAGKALAWLILIGMLAILGLEVTKLLNINSFSIPRGLTKVPILIMTLLLYISIVLIAICNHLSRHMPQARGPRIILFLSSFTIIALYIIPWLRKPLISIVFSGRLWDMAPMIVIMFAVQFIYALIAIFRNGFKDLSLNIRMISVFNWVLIFVYAGVFYSLSIQRGVSPGTALSLVINKNLSGFALLILLLASLTAVIEYAMKRRQPSATNPPPAMATNEAGA